MKTSSILFGLGGLYLLSQQRAQTPAATNPAGQQPQQPSAAKPSTGGGAGMGASSTAGRGGDPKAGGGAQTGSIEDAFGTFPNAEGPSVIEQLFNDFNNTPTPPADLNLFGDQPIGDISAIGITTGNDVPVFGGDPNLQVDPTSGLIIDPSTGQPFGADPSPDVVDLTGLANMPSVIGGGSASALEDDVPVPDFTVDDGSPDLAF